MGKTEFFHGIGIELIKDVAGSKSSKKPGKDGLKGS